MKKSVRQDKHIQCRRGLVKVSTCIGYNFNASLLAFLLYFFRLPVLPYENSNFLFTVRKPFPLVLLVLYYPNLPLNFIKKVRDPLILAVDGYFW